MQGDTPKVSHATPRVAGNANPSSKTGRPARLVNL